MNIRKEGISYGTQKKIITTAMIMLLVSMPTLIVVGQLAIQIPGNIRYYNAFGGQIVITEQQPTLTGMVAGLNKIWIQMNDTFGTTNQATTYGSGFYWDFTPQNSIASESIFFRAEIQRLDNYSALYNQYLKAGNMTVTGLPITDWYGQIVNSSHDALKQGASSSTSGSGLDWAIKGAWYLKFDPLVYWFPFYEFIYIIIAITSFLILMFLRIIKY